jgi:hypothetical protein
MGQGMPGFPGQPGAMPGMPPNLANMLNGMMRPPAGGAPGAQPGGARINIQMSGQPGQQPPINLGALLGSLGGPGGPGGPGGAPPNLGALLG